MKNIYYLIFLSGLLLVFLAGCKDDETDYSGTDKSDPQLVLTSTDLHWVQDKDVFIKAKITDDLGIKSVHLSNDAWFLDKTIEVSKDTLVTSYDLNYKFRVPKEAVTDEKYVINLTVTDVAGNKVTGDLNVYMDGDFTKPSYRSVPDEALTVLVSENVSFRAVFEVTDNKDLAYLIIRSDEPLNYYDSIVLSGKTARIDQKIDLLPGTIADYKFEYILADKAGNLAAQKNSIVQVKDMPDFDKMYLADVATKEELNTDLFGVPMLMDHVGPYQYEVSYYAAKAGTEVRFIPQKSAFEPICFALLDGSVVNTQEGQPVILPEKGYYKVNINIQTGVYRLQRLFPTVATPNETVFDAAGDGSWMRPVEVGLIGHGVTNAGYVDNWSTSTPLLLTMDTDNKYIYRLDVSLKGNVQLMLSAKHEWGWWNGPYWKSADGVDLERVIENGGSDMGVIIVDEETAYTLIFDAYLNRVRVVKK